MDEFHLAANPRVIYFTISVLLRPVFSPVYEFSLRRNTFVWIRRFQLDKTCLFVRRIYWVWARQIYAWGRISSTPPVDFRSLSADINPVSSAFFGMHSETFGRYGWWMLTLKILLLTFWSFWRRYIIFQIEHIVINNNEKN